MTGRRAALAGWLRSTIERDRFPLSPRIRRREFLISTALLASTIPASAQGPTEHARIGWLAHGDTMPRQFFDAALARLGWVEGKNLTIERRFAGSAGERVASDAAELVAARPDVIIAMGGIDAVPILSLTRTIPIVIVTIGDPVGQGFAQSLAHPGQNVTGTASMTNQLLPKLFELARELLPQCHRISVLTDPSSPGYIKLPEMFDPLGLKITTREASRPEELDAAISAAAAEGDSAIAVQFVALTFEERRRIAELAVRFRLPVLYPLREYVEAGGLISYGAMIRDNFERAAVLTDKILRGANPADLPFEQPTKFELVINLKTAKALGLTVPQSLLARADEVIE